MQVLSYHRKTLHMQYQRFVPFGGNATLKQINLSTFSLLEAFCPTSFLLDFYLVQACFSLVWPPLSLVCLPIPCLSFRCSGFAMVLLKVLGGHHVPRSFVIGFPLTNSALFGVCSAHQQISLVEFHPLLPLLSLSTLDGARHLLFLVPFQLQWACLLL